MKRYDQVYKALSVVNTLVHILLVIFLVIVAFMPFRENQTFYQTYDYAWLYLLIPLAAAFLAALAVKRPLWSLGSLLLTGLFFFAILLPYMTEALVVGFASIGVAQTNMGLWQQGFTLMSGAVDILFWDVAFAIYAIVIAIVRAVYSHHPAATA